MAKSITKEEFEKRIKDRFPTEDFKIIQYTNTSAPFKIQCLKCGKILENPQAKNFLAKHKIAGCSDCNGLRAKNNSREKQLQEKYEIIKKEKNENNKILYTCKCKMCGRIATYGLDNFLNTSCRCEGKGKHWTEEEFKNKIFQEYGNEYMLLTPFKTVNTKALFKHSCGFTWSVTPAHVLYNKTGCPKCCKKQSKGCRIVEQQLKTLNIFYEKEKFLKNSLQRFDFYFEIGDKKFAIEYNGEQHYKYNPFFHGRDESVFLKYQERDLRKKEYCKENNIELIIIPYTFTTEEIKIYINKLFSSSTTSSFERSFK